MNESVKNDIVTSLGNNEMAKCLQLVERIKPSSLFKYRSGISWNEETNEYYDVEALIKGQLWMSLATELDDPYDCSVLFSEDLTKIVKTLRATSDRFSDDKYITDVERANSSMRETSLVCSLTENLDDVDM